jgi:hydrogenase maturation protein HypF
LRDTKPRPHKPLAVMFPVPFNDKLSCVNQHLLPTRIEAQQLESHARPIVLVQKKPQSENPHGGLSAGIAPDLIEIGAMLPYSPLHHILLNDFGAPLVASSANISGEPVLTDNQDIEQRLAHVANAFLHHDRPIVRPADDPVIRVVNDQATAIRQGRGLAPVEIDLPFELDSPVIATGAHMKNTVTLAWGRRAVVSPHIGEMDSPRSLQTFTQCIHDLQMLYQVKATHIVCDSHPGYAPTRWAHQQNFPVHEIYHHHAHAGAVYAETKLRQKTLDDLLVFTWDGVGLGPDGTLWGGEALLGQPGQWQRVASFRPFKLPGGERAGREPWRSAAAVCWAADLDCPLDEASDPLLHSFWQQGINAPTSTAVGRLFDAAAALCGVCTQASFEGQGPMQLEALAASVVSFDASDCITLELANINGIYVTDWAALIPMLTDNAYEVATRAMHFHTSMAYALLEQAKRVRDDSGIEVVGLAGGVFQNRVLTEKCINLLGDNGFRVSLPLMTPVNDAAISFGQIIEYGYNRR